MLVRDAWRRDPAQAPAATAAADARAKAPVSWDAFKAEFPEDFPPPLYGTLREPRPVLVMCRPELRPEGEDVSAWGRNPPWPLPPSLFSQAAKAEWYQRFPPPYGVAA